MATIEHKVLMHGRAVRGNGAAPAAAGAVLMVLGGVLRGAVEMAFRRSSGVGRRQSWLRIAGQADFKHAAQTSKDEMALYFEAAQFGDVAQDYFVQPRLFDDGPKATDTAFDVLADSVEDVLARKTDSERFDVGLLKRFHRFETSVFTQDVSELLLSGHRILESRPCRISPEVTARAEELYLQTPQPGRVRIAGKLDMVQASTLAFELLLPAGERVRGVWKANEFETLRSLANTDVVASGIAVYRPSGALLRVDAESLAPQRPGDGIFATVPTPTGMKLDLKSLVREQKRRGGVAAMLGKLPAEESDEQFLAAIAEMD
jgi:hypothetical protein